MSGLLLAAALTITVYGSRVEDPAERMPASVCVFRADEIASAGARDLPELLEKGANIQIRTLNANPLQAQIAMGGFGENSFGRVKLIVDGEELNSSDMDAPDIARLSLAGIDRVEVIRGASPVLYGDGAIAGVINVTTDSRDYETKTRLAVKGGAYGTLGFSGRTKGGSAEDGVAYSAAYGYQRSDGYRHRSGYDLHTADASIRQDFENGSWVRLKANYANVLYEMPGALTWREWQDDPRQAKYEDDWCRGWNYGFSMASKVVLADAQCLYLDGAFSLKHRTSHWGDYGYANDYDLYAYQFSPRYVNEMDIGSLANKGTMGSDVKYERYAVDDRSGLNLSVSHFERLRGGLFARDELAITDTLSLIAGARFEGIHNRWAHIQRLAETSSCDWMGDYELGLVYRPVGGVKTYVKGTRYHRSAFSDELSYTADGNFLKPETGTTLDLGFEAAFLDEFKFDAVGYWSVIDDEIFYNPHVHDYGGGFWGGFNCNYPGRTERIGVETGLSWCREQVAEAALRAAVVRADFAGGQYRGKDVPVVPESRARVEVGIWLLDDLKLKGGARFVSRQVLAGDFENSHRGLPGYSIFDLALIYEPSWAEGWKASFVVDNLLGRSFCDFAGWSDYTGAYYYPACGRNFLLTLAYSF